MDADEIWRVRLAEARRWHDHMRANLPELGRMLDGARSYFDEAASEAAWGLLSTEDSEPFDPELERIRDLLREAEGYDDEAGEWAQTARDIYHLPGAAKDDQP